LNVHEAEIDLLRIRRVAKSWDAPAALQNFTRRSEESFSTAAAKSGFVMATVTSAYANEHRPKSRSDNGGVAGRLAVQLASESLIGFRLWVH
jgi:hypothetical protein